MLTCLLATAVAPQLTLELVDTINVTPAHVLVGAPSLATVYAHTKDGRLMAFRRGQPPKELATPAAKEWLCGTSIDGLPVTKSLNPLKTIGESGPAKTHDPYNGILEVHNGVIFGYAAEAMYVSWEVVPPREHRLFGTRDFRNYQIPREDQIGGFSVSPSRQTFAFRRIHLKTDPSDTMWYANYFARLNDGPLVTHKVSFNGPNDKSSSEIGSKIRAFELLNDTTAVALLSANAFDDPKPAPTGFTGFGNDTFAPEDIELLVCRVDIESGKVDVAQKKMFKAVSPLEVFRILTVFDDKGTFALLSSPTELQLFRFGR